MTNVVGFEFAAGESLQDNSLELDPGDILALRDWLSRAQTCLFNFELSKNIEQVASDIF